MNMHDEVYTDGVGEITVSGTVVRVDLVSLSPTERDANNAPRSVFRQRLIFSLEGFANSVELMQKALQGLVEAGAVTRTQRRPPTVSPVAAPSVDPSPNTAEKLRTANASPNFS
jgi:hypothetical protein